ncbi:MAG: 16S rRNA (cytosine(1402)-N(4))-methyltransferase RsmH [Gammaproteobacteria bacterium]|nr:16S rRNA (cytosine(1402)-N(4))-methyltransferase RsmH [Gammaproteobacteria bacterium]
MHEPALLVEALEALQLRDDGMYVDCTFGRGGHTRGILDRLGPTGRVLAIDCDPEAFAAGMKLAMQDQRLCVERRRFGDLDAIAAYAGFGSGVNGILLDLGVSSPQLDVSGRGFSFAAEAPLDMRMDPGAGESAAAWLAHASEREIADVLFHFGEERHSRRIARAIVAARSAEPIITTVRLAAIVARCMPRGRGRIHPATRTFQALRIHVNDELRELERVLPAAVALLKVGGRLVVISFHSLEDRVVKRFLRAESRPAQVVGGAQSRPRLRLAGKLVRPGEAEISRNPRSRSARMRVAERIA